MNIHSLPQKNVPTNKILQGNCIDLMKGLPDNSVDLVFADPYASIELIDSDRSSCKKDRKPCM